MPHIPGMSSAPWSIIIPIVIAIILACIFGGLIRRHLARLAGSLAFGAVAAFGVTDWVDGHRHAALAQSVHGLHGATVTSTLTWSFAVITLVAAAIAFTVASLVAGRRGSYSAPDTRAYRGRSRARAW